jgi:hypothetical protein
MAGEGWGRGKAYRAAIHSVAAILFAYFLVLSLRPLTNHDLWLHLNVGREIVRQGALPGAEDPFTYTSRTPLPEGVVKMQRTQWLAQAAMYGVYAAGSEPALIVFRSLLALLPLAFIYWCGVRRGGDPPILLASLLPGAFILSMELVGYFERPQAFSFVLVVALAGLLLWSRRPGAAGRAVLAVGCLTALWGNLHGGVVAGDLVILAFLIGESGAWALARLSPRRIGMHVERGRVGTALALSVAGIVGSFLNPNTYRTVYDLGAGLARHLVGEAGSGGAGYVMTQVMEYRPLWFVYAYLGSPMPIYVSALGAVAGATMLAGYAERRRIDLAEFAAACMIGGLALAYVRMAPMGVMLFCLLGARAATRLNGLMLRRAAIAAMVMAALLVPGGAVLGGQGKRLAPSLPARTVDAGFPDRALAFMRDAGIGGPVFNPLHWGGYMVFYGYVERVFVDGRSLDDLALRDAHTVLNAGPGWEGILDRYGVRSIVIPVVALETFDPVPLAMALPTSGVWRLVHVDAVAMVAVREDPANEAVIASHGRPWREMWEVMLAVSDVLARRQPANPVPHMTRVIALHNLGRYALAREAARAARAAAAGWEPGRAREVLATVGAMGY